MKRGGPVSATATACWHTAATPSDAARAAASAVSQPREPALVQRVSSASAAAAGLAQPRALLPRSCSGLRSGWLDAHGTVCSSPGSAVSTASDSATASARSRSASAEAEAAPGRPPTARARHAAPSRSATMQSAAAATNWACAEVQTAARGVAVQPRDARA